MVEFTRAHERLQKAAVAGEQIKLDRAEALITPGAAAAGEADFLIHFHGSSWLPFQAAAATRRPLVVIAVNVGQGGNAYDQAFSDPAALEKLIAPLRARVRIRRLYLSGFSAGYGAVRAILRSRSEMIEGILLLDGLHTSYAADCKVDPVAMQPFLDYAREAVLGHKQFVFTHSEIFPGTFASTTETADYLIQQLGLKPKRKVRVKYADSRYRLRDEVDGVQLSLQGRVGMFKAIVEPKRDTALIGAIVREDLDFLIDCEPQRLVPSDPKYVVGELE